MNNYVTKEKILLFFLLFCFITGHRAQVVNYVNNPGFEIALPSISYYPYNAAEYWSSLDTAKSAFYLVSTLSSQGNNSPYCQFGFQYPRTGDNFILCTFYCSGCLRFYPRNRIKEPLKPNTIYCAKYYVVNTDNSVVGTNSYGAYFGDGTLDTITNCNGQLTYLNPQVQYQSAIITDTLKWTAITGTFVASGIEKYLVLGNFRADASTNTIIINSTYLPDLVTDVYIDDLSLIELNLPAFACANSYTYTVPGDSVFLGRQPDVGIDEDCMWYKLPNDSVAIDTVAGFWAKPVMTTTYVVRQEICGNVKWDTVVVSISAVGLKDLGLMMNDLRLYPIPAQDELKIQWSLDGLEKEFTKGDILNGLGQVVSEMDLNYRNKSATVSVKDLAEGVYAIRLLGANSECISKRFIKK